MRYGPQPIEDMPREELERRIDELESLGKKITSRQASRLRELRAALENIRGAMRGL